jgi:hypothetical protein
MNRLFRECFGLSLDARKVIGIFINKKIANENKNASFGSRIANCPPGTK